MQTYCWERSSQFADQLKKKTNLKQKNPPKNRPKNPAQEA